MTGEGKRKKDGEMGIIQTQNLMGMLLREREEVGKVEKIKSRPAGKCLAGLRD